MYVSARVMSHGVKQQFSHQTLPSHPLSKFCLPKTFHLSVWDV